jgi:hypothetical protein
MTGLPTDESGRTGANGTASDRMIELENRCKGKV